MFDLEFLALFHLFWGLFDIDTRHVTVYFISRMKLSVAGLWSCWIFYFQRFWIVYNCVFSWSHALNDQLEKPNNLQFRMIVKSIMTFIVPQSSCSTISFVTQRANFVPNQIFWYGSGSRNIHENACKYLIPNITRDLRVRPGGDHWDLPCRRRGFESRRRILFFGNPDNFEMAEKG